MSFQEKQKKKICIKNIEEKNTFSKEKKKGEPIWYRIVKSEFIKIRDHVGRNTVSMKR